MKFRRICNLMYPIITVLPAYSTALLLLLFDRFSWLGLEVTAMTGLIIGVIAELLVICTKFDFLPYLKRILLSVVLAAVFWGAAVILRQALPLPWGWWLSRAGQILENVLLFVPAVGTSVYWCVTGKSAVDRILLLLTNPVLHAAVWWHIVDTLLSCLPT